MLEMVFYFSGTGNSLYIARNIAAQLGEKMISISEEVLRGSYKFGIKEGESIGFVYPVHRMGPPEIVLDFIKKLEIEGYAKNYVYSVFNCAGTYEYTARIIKKALDKKGYKMSGDYHVIMPGNYITVKSKITKAQSLEFLACSDEKIAGIVKSIRYKESNYKKEKHSFVLSYIVRNIGRLEKTMPFEVNERCTGCGQCMRICPMKAITLENMRPHRYQEKCTFCLGCINCCPCDAINFGKNTVGKERYIHPEYTGFIRKEWRV